MWCLLKARAIYLHLLLEPFRGSSSVPKTPYVNNKADDAQEYLLLQCPPDCVEVGQLIRVAYLAEIST